MRQPSRKGVAAARAVHLLEHVKCGLNLSLAKSVYFDPEFRLEFECRLYAQLICVRVKRKNRVASKMKNFG
jgi:hypothetical protein